MLFIKSLMRNHIFIDMMNLVHTKTNNKNLVLTLECDMVMKTRLSPSIIGF